MEIIIESIAEISEDKNRRTRAGGASAGGSRRLREPEASSDPEAPAGDTPGSVAVSKAGSSSALS